MPADSVASYYKTHRASFPEPFRLRIHRALSWLNRAQAAAQQPESAGGADWDTCFITAWIAFNAAYAKDLDYDCAPLSERDSFRSFLNTVCSLDKQRAVYSLIWQKFPNQIARLLENRYVFQPFWDFHNGKISQAVWEERFAASRCKARKSLEKRDTTTVLAVVFGRLYTLRNQMVHGGATCRSSANRSQLHEGCTFLLDLIPPVLQIMMLHPCREDWGQPFYPFVKE